MARSRRYAEYSAAPLRSGRSPSRPWLRTAQLNAVGWAALLGLCAAAAGVGFAILRWTGLPSWPGVALALAPLGAVVLADRKRWAGMTTGFGWGGSPDDVAGVVAALRSEGVSASVELDGPALDTWVELGVLPAGVSMPETASLTYRNRDARRVQAVLRRRGIDVPEPLW
ncbi:MAG: hypothetical protein L0H79_05995 [Intrasporangium sp.]|uniref:hypothetical protein n=1 Tax=Intrasporangium sp. TaxID=1925024 RepID=UPI002647D052|nr:hypothetical protein [Intrasporangium sp.]MDN5795290.1 hypothetical protein [Intrasporangium sp.]